MATTVPGVDLLIRWACQQYPAGNRSIGSHAVARVLVTLASFAGPDGSAWPSADTIAENTGGMSRRQVREALEILEAEGYIRAAGRRSRAKRWTFVVVDNLPEVAGYPATSTLFEVAGEMAGEMAGQVAGEMAGYPATSGVELSSSPLPPKRSKAPDRSLRVVEEGGESKKKEKPASEIAPALQSALRSHGIPDRDMSAVLRAAQADPETTYPEGRLTKSKTYALGCWATIKSARTAALNSGPRCEDHTDQPARHCTSCISDVKCGDRHPDYIGRRMPANRTA